MVHAACSTHFQVKNPKISQDVNGRDPSHLALRAGHAPWHVGCHFHCSQQLPADCLMQPSHQPEESTNLGSSCLSCPLFYGFLTGPKPKKKKSFVMMDCFVVFWSWCSTGGIFTCSTFWPPALIQLSWGLVISRSYLAFHIKELLWIP